MRKNSELFFNLILLPIDFIAIISSFVLAYAIRVKVENRPVANPLEFSIFLKIFLLIIPVWILIFALSGLYNQSSLRGRIDELGKIFIAVSGGTMFIILVDFFSRQPVFPSKAVPIYGYGISLVLVVLGRQIVRAVQRSLFSFGIGLHRALVVGSGPIAQRILADLGHTKRSGYRIIGVLDTAEGAAERVKGFRLYQDFDEIAQNSQLDEIIQADSALEPEEVLSLVNYASNNQMIYRFIPNQFGLYATNSSMGSLAGLPSIEIKQTPLDGWGRIVKRGFDILGAGLGLIVLSPLMILIGLVIKLTDRGPAFYRHKRLSRSGRIIKVFKFRTMYFKYCTGDDYSGKNDAEIFNQLGRPELFAEFAKEQKLTVDPRVTPIGRFLRKTSLDELPQLLNVLEGSISLVGPRPIVEAELPRYGKEQATFLALKPGITGLWQISGRSDLGYDERVKLDIYYVENWSIGLDLRILMKTLFSFLKGQGAY